MSSLLKNWKVLLLIALIALSVFSLAFNGLKFGIDFKGGTQFQIHLAEPVPPLKMQQVVTVISQRLDWTGLKDTKVTSWGEEFVLAQLAETDQAQIEKIESLLKKQGKFEATLDGNILFEGEEIISIFKDPSKGYGYRQEGTEQEPMYRWSLPFLLNGTAAKRFTEMTFHKCSIASFEGTTKQYNCERTYFFIDRPKNAVIVIPMKTYLNDKQLFLQGNKLKNIPQSTEIEDVLKNIGLPYFVVDQNFSEEQKAELSAIVGTTKTLVVPPEFGESLGNELTGMGFQLKEFPLVDASVPWVWQMSGARQIISLTEGVTNLDPYVADPKDAKQFNELLITGSAAQIKDAQDALEELTVLLESGSLPIAVESISKETISPSLGANFFQNALIMGLVALIVVAVVIYVRYRKLSLVLPIAFTSFSEVVIILGFASAISWNLDLAAVAGIIAAVGTGVDSQIIITDELLKGEREASGSMFNRLKRAFFIVFASAATVVAVMAPIILIGGGLGKIVGFAITTIAGVLIGVLFTRPAFGEIAQRLLQREQRMQEQKTEKGKD